MSPDPLLALLAGLLVLGLLAALFWPDRGLVAFWQRSQHLTQRVLGEDALKYIYKQELDGRPVGVAGLAGTLGINRDRVAGVLDDLLAQELVCYDDGELCLTDNGRETALHVIRVHRLWEHYLADQTGFAEAEWHRRAEEKEHSLTRDEADVLSAELGYPGFDPHGDPIPTATGEVAPRRGQPLTRAPLDLPLRVLHIEDEPEAVYEQLVAERIAPGMVLRLSEVTSTRLRAWSARGEHVLAPVVAANITVEPVAEDNGAGDVLAGQPLSSLRPGELGVVTGIAPNVRGAERRRLLDLGVLPGTEIIAELRSPSGNPMAYRIRGAVIALRDDQARMISVQPNTKEVTA